MLTDMNIKKGGKSLRHLSARTVTSRVKNTFENHIMSMKKELSTVSSVCTTADVWSSRTRRFIGMTAHWVR